MALVPTEHSWINAASGRVITFGLQFNSAKVWRPSNATHLYGESVVPYRGRQIIWYQVDGGSTESKLCPPELCKMHRWLVEGDYLPRTRNTMDVAVVVEGYPYEKMMPNQAERLSRMINRPKKCLFKKSRYEKGALIFTCFDKAAKKILKDALPRLDNTLEVGPIDILTHGIKFILCTYLAKTMTTDQILESIEKENRDISTKEWNVVERSEFSLTVWVDNISLNQLRVKSLKLNLGQSEVEFRPLVNLNKINSQQENSGVESHSNLSTDSVPLYLQASTNLPTGWVITFGLQSDVPKLVSEEQKHRLRNLLEKQARQRMVPFRERSITWYRVDGQNIKSNPESPHLTELYNIYARLSIGRRLSETSSTHELAVVLEGYPYKKMSKSHADKICKMPKLSNNSPFVATRYENGALIFKCANKAAKIALRDSIAETGGALEAGPVDIVSHGIKFIFCYPANGMTADEILECVERQNNGISTKEWNVVEMSELSLTVWVDNQTLNALRTRNFKLRLGQSEVEFRPLINHKEMKLAVGCDETSSLQHIETIVTERMVSNPSNCIQAIKSSVRSQNSQLVVAEPFTDHRGACSGLEIPHLGRSKISGLHQEPPEASVASRGYLRLSQVLESLSKPCSSTEPNRGSRDLDPPPADKSRIKNTSLSQFLESVSKPSGSTEVAGPSRPFADLKAACEMYKHSSLTEALERISKACNSTKCVERSCAGLEIPTVAETTSTDSRLSTFLETVCKPLGLQESHKRTFSNLEQESASGTSFKTSRLFNVSVRSNNEPYSGNRDTY